MTTAKAMASVGFDLVPIPADPSHRAPDEPVRHYRFLDGLRGATATYVMAYHLLAWVPSSLPKWVARLRQPLSFGHVAVSVFIVLSGYSLGLPVARDVGRKLRGGLRSYLVRRATRILPAYYTALVISIVVSASVGRSTDAHLAKVDLSVGSILSHFALLHNLSPTYTLTINMSHWSVAAEWQIYFLFPLVLLPAWRHLGTLGMVAVGILVSAIPLMIFDSRHNFAWTCPWYFGLFAVGAAASSFEMRPLGLVARWLTLAIAGVLAVAYMAVHIRFRQPGANQIAGVEFFKDSSAGIVVAMVLIYLVYRRNFSGGSILLSILEFRLFRWLGVRSYSLYLIHCTILSVCLSVAARLQLSDIESFTVRLAFGIPASLFAAAIMYAAVERPYLNRRVPAL